MRPTALVAKNSPVVCHGPGPGVKVGGDPEAGIVLSPYPTVRCGATIRVSVRVKGMGILGMADSGCCQWGYLRSHC